MDNLTISIWQAIIATAGGVTLAVVLPLIVAFLTFKTWIKNVIKSELSDFSKETTKQLKEIGTRLDRIPSFERFIEQKAQDLKDKPNPPLTLKNELLDKWHNQTLTYPESLELKGILEQQSQSANTDDATKALIAIVIIGLALYLLTHD